MSPPAALDPLDDFELVEGMAETSPMPLYRKGTGPAVLVVSEIPGITPQVADFARRVAAAGFTAAMPVLFGVPGKPMTNRYALSSMRRACVSSEFVCLAKGRRSPVTDRLIELAKELHDECGGPGVGVVGMCLTGGFALAMMIDPVVVAPVLSQPSLPLPVGAARRRDLGISDDELQVVKERAAGGCTVLGLRFSEDPVAPAERFARLRDELGDGFVGVEIDSSKGNPHGFAKMAHSVLTLEYRDEPGHPTHDADRKVIEHLRAGLSPGEG